MPVIVAVQPHLVRINHTIIILSRNLLHRTLISLRLLLRRIFGNNLVLQSVLQCCRTCNVRTQLQHIPVRPDQLVSISRNVWARSYEGHISNQHIPQTRKFIQFIVTQNSSERSNPRITCDRNRRTIMLDRHRPKLMAVKEFTIFAHTFLHEERWPVRHLHFHHNCHDHQYWPQEEQSDQCHHSIENSFKYHYLYRIFGICSPCLILSIFRQVYIRQNSTRPVYARQGHESSSHFLLQL